MNTDFGLYPTPTLYSDSFWTGGVNSPVYSPMISTGAAMRQQAYITQLQTQLTNLHSSYIALYQKYENMQPIQQYDAYQSIASELGDIRVMYDNQFRRLKTVDPSVTKAALPPIMPVGRAAFRV